jgi:hypothetical protein
MHRRSQISCEIARDHRVLRCLKQTQKSHPRAQSTVTNTCDERRYEIEQRSEHLKPSRNPAEGYSCHADCSKRVATYFLLGATQSSKAMGMTHRYIGYAWEVLTDSSRTRSRTVRRETCEPCRSGSMIRHCVVDGPRRRSRPHYIQMIQKALNLASACLAMGC